MTSIYINKFHTWNIRITITYIHHISKRHMILVGFKIRINALIIYIQNTLLNSKQKLRFIRVIYNLSWPNSLSSIIIIKRTRIYFFKLFLQMFDGFRNLFLQTLDNFFDLSYHKQALNIAG